MSRSLRNIGIVLLLAIEAGLIYLTKLASRIAFKGDDAQLAVAKSVKPEHITARAAQHLTTGGFQLILGIGLMLLGFALMALVAILLRNWVVNTRPKSNFGPPVSRRSMEWSGAIDRP